MNNNQGHNQANPGSQPTTFALQAGQNSHQTANPKEGTQGLNISGQGTTHLQLPAPTGDSSFSFRIKSKAASPGPKTQAKPPLPLPPKKSKKSTQKVLGKAEEDIITSTVSVLHKYLGKTEEEIKTTASESERLMDLGWELLKGSDVDESNADMKKLALVALEALKTGGLKMNPVEFSLLKQLKFRVSRADDDENRSEFGFERKYRSSGVMETDFKGSRGQEFGKKSEAKKVNFFSGKGSRKPRNPRHAHRASPCRGQLTSKVESTQELALNPQKDSLNKELFMEGSERSIHYSEASSSIYDEEGEEEWSVNESELTSGAGSYQKGPLEHLDGIVCTATFGGRTDQGRSNEASRGTVDTQKTSGREEMGSISVSHIVGVGNLKGRYSKDLEDLGSQEDRHRRTKRTRATESSRGSPCDPKTLSGSVCQKHQSQDEEFMDGDDYRNTREEIDFQDPRRPDVAMNRPQDYYDPASEDTINRGKMRNDQRLEEGSLPIIHERSGDSDQVRLHTDRLNRTMVSGSQDERGDGFINIGTSRDHRPPQSSSFNDQSVVGPQDDSGEGPGHPEYTRSQAKHRQHKRNILNSREEETFILSSSMIQHDSRALNYSQNGGHHPGDVLNGDSREVGNSSRSQSKMSKNSVPRLNLSKMSISKPSIKFNEENVNLETQRNESSERCPPKEHREESVAYEGDTDRLMDRMSQEVEVITGTLNSCMGSGKEELGSSQEGPSQDDQISSRDRIRINRRTVTKCDQGAERRSDEQGSGYQPSSGGISDRIAMQDCRDYDSDEESSTVFQPIEDYRRQKHLERSNCNFLKESSQEKRDDRCLKGEDMGESQIERSEGIQAKEAAWNQKEAASRAYGSSRCQHDNIQDQTLRNESNTSYESGVSSRRRSNAWKTGPRLPIEPGSELQNLPTEQFVRKTMESQMNTSRRDSALNQSSGVQRERRRGIQGCIKESHDEHLIEGQLASKEINELEMNDEPVFKASKSAMQVPPTLPAPSGSTQSQVLERADVGENNVKKGNLLAPEVNNPEQSFSQQNNSHSITLTTNKIDFNEVSNTETSQGGNNTPEHPRIDSEPEKTPVKKSQSQIVPPPPPQTSKEPKRISQTNNVTRRASRSRKIGSTPNQAFAKPPPPPSNYDNNKSISRPNKVTITQKRALSIDKIMGRVERSLSRPGRVNEALQPRRSVFMRTGVSPHHIKRVRKGPVIAPAFARVEKGHTVRIDGRPHSKLLCSEKMISETAIIFNQPQGGVQCSNPMTFRGSINQNNSMSRVSAQGIDNLIGPHQSSRDANGVVINHPRSHATVAVTPSRTSEEVSRRVSCRSLVQTNGTRASQRVYMDSRRSKLGKVVVTDSMRRIGGTSSLKRSLGAERSSTRRNPVQIQVFREQHVYPGGMGAQKPPQPNFNRFGVKRDNETIGSGESGRFFPQ